MKIKNPKTNNSIEIHSKEGEKLLNHYTNLLNEKKGGNNCKEIKIKSSIKCDKYPLIDLSNLKLEKNLFKKCKEISFDDNYFSLTINNEKHHLCKYKFISQGSYGKIYSISDINNKYNIALKTYFNKNDDEIKIVKQLIKKKIDCNLINMRLFTTQDGETVGIMNLMNGNLDNFQKVTISNIKNIIKQLCETFIKLLKYKLVYIDLKAENILYKCYDNNVIKILLGDLGSLCKKNKNGPLTWCPWEFRKTLKTKCVESSIVWCLGVVILELLKHNVDIFHWSSIGNKLKETEIKNKIILSINKFKKTIPLLPKILDFDPKKRITLQEIINQL